MTLEQVQYPFKPINLTIPQAIDMTVWQVKRYFEHIRITLGEE